MSVQIRPFAEADRPACQAIAASAALTAYGAHMPPESFGPHEPLEPADQRAVAVVDGEIVGFIELVGAHVSNVFVGPAAQGKGVGALMMAWAEAQTDGPLTLSVFTVNPNARRFYERLGFVVEGIKTIAFAGGEHEVWRMRKDRAARL